jgi:hypothetical protein
MRVLRANKDSVMAMLEAFVHDPLISWRLLAPPRVSPTATAFKPTAAVSKVRFCVATLVLRCVQHLRCTMQPIVYSHSFIVLTTCMLSTPYRSMNSSINTVPYAPYYASTCINILGAHGY